MFTLLTDTGKDKLANLAGNKIKFTGFSVGLFAGTLTDLKEILIDNRIFPEASLTTFTQGYYGTISSMVYQFMDDNMTVLKCFVPPQVNSFNFNMVVLYAELDEDEFPFIISYALEDNPKLSTVQNKYGMRYFMIHQLNLSDRDVRFDFSNLNIESVEFVHYEHNYSTPDANKELHDQVIIDNHVNTPDNHKVFAIESESQHFGVLLQPWSLEDNYQALQVDGEDVQIDGQTVYLPVNSHASSVVLNNVEIDTLSFEDENLAFTILDGYSLVIYDEVDPPQYVVVNN